MINSFRYIDGYASTNSILLDGVDEYLDIDTAVSELVSHTTGSISMWFYADTISVQNGLFGLYVSSSNMWVLKMAGDNKIQLRHAVGGTTQINYKTNNTFSVNTWYHISIVQDGTAIKIYMDGVNQTLTKTTDLDATLWFDNLSGVATKANIGAEIGNNFFNGYIDDVRIWSSDLTSGEVTDDYNSGCPTTPLDTNLAIHYKMGEGATHPTIPDEVGALDGTMTNTEVGDITTTTPC